MLAGFALTETSAGSDAYHVQSRATLQADGSWLLNGDKRYIGNGSKAGLFTTLARAEVDGRDSHIALIVTADMDGFAVGERFDTMGLRANDLRRLHFRDVRVPPENVLGEPGKGFTSRCRYSTTAACRLAADRLAGRAGCSTWPSGTPAGASSSVSRWPSSSSSARRSAGWAPRGTAKIRLKRLIAPVRRSSPQTTGCA